MSHRPILPLPLPQLRLQHRLWVHIRRLVIYSGPKLQHKVVLWHHLNPYGLAEFCLILQIHIQQQIGFGYEIDGIDSDDKLQQLRDIRVPFGVEQVQQEVHDYLPNKGLRDRGVGWRQCDAIENMFE